MKDIMDMRRLNKGNQEGPVSNQAHAVLKEKLAIEFAKHCKEKGISRSELLRRLIRECLNKEKKKKK